MNDDFDNELDDKAIQGYLEGDDQTDFLDDEDIALPYTDPLPSERKQGGVPAYAVAEMARINAPVIVTTPEDPLRAALRAWERDGAPNRKSLAAFGLRATLAAPPVEVGEDACPCGHEDHEHVHYCSHETKAGSCPCNEEYVIRSAAPALDVAVRNFLAAWPNIVNHPRLDNVEVAALRAALEGARRG